MTSMTKVASKMITRVEKTLLELADAHCHLDLLSDTEIKNAIEFGVKTMITNGVDFASNQKAFGLSDDKHIFANYGVDPEHAIKISDEELKQTIFMIKNSHNLVGIGEIGLDNDGKIGNPKRQRMVFERMLDLALELNVPVSIHSRNAMDDVLSILEQKNVKKAHIHFFDGNVEQAKRVERSEYMISIPPIESEKRRKVIKEVSIDYIMAESDAPAAGKSPKDVIKSIEIIAESKRISVELAAEAVVRNTKRFFNLDKKQNSAFMRY